MKTKLTYGAIDYSDYLDRYLEASIISDIMWAHGYDITDLDAYRAWIAGSEGVWEHPYDYEDAQVVEEVLGQCFMEPSFYEEVPEDGSGAPTPPYEDFEFVDNGDIITDEEWNNILNSLEEDLENYEAKNEPRVEGEAFTKRNGTDPLTEAVFN